jgi:hypothetical protein
VYKKAEETYPENQFVQCSLCHHLHHLVPGEQLEVVLVRRGQGLRLVQLVWTHLMVRLELVLSGLGEEHLELVEVR